MKKFKKISGMVLAEIVMALAVCAIIFGVSIALIKQNDLSVTPYTYFVMENLAKANDAIMEDCYQSGICETRYTLPDNRTTYCLLLSKHFSAPGNVACYKMSSSDRRLTTNFTLSNGVSFIGLVNNDDDWQPNDDVDDTIGDGNRQYIDITVDINGDKGDSEVGTDRFPVRIFKNGEVVPGILAFDGNGSANQFDDFINDPESFAFNVVLNKGAQDESTNSITNEASNIYSRVKSPIPNGVNVSFRDAVCLAYSINSTPATGINASYDMRNYYSDGEVDTCDNDNDDIDRAAACTPCASGADATATTCNHDKSAFCEIVPYKPNATGFLGLFKL